MQAPISAAHTILIKLSLIPHNKPLSATSTTSQMLSS